MSVEARQLMLWNSLYNLLSFFNNVLSQSHTPLNKNYYAYSHFLEYNIESNAC